MNLKTKIFLPAILAGSVAFGAVNDGKLSDKELFDATVKHVDFGGKELQYYNLRGLKDVVNKFIGGISTMLAQSPEFAKNPQAQLGLMAIAQVLDLAGIDSVQSAAQSISDTGSGNGRIRSFIYTGANPQGLYFDFVSRQDRPFALLNNIPSSADGMIAMGCFLDFNRAWEGLKKNVTPGSQAGAMPIMLEMQYEQANNQKLSTLLNSISGEYQLIARLYMNSDGKGTPSGDIYLSIPDSDGTLAALLKKFAGQALKTDANGTIFLPRDAKMPDFVVPRIEFVPGRVIVASGAPTAESCKPGKARFNCAPLMKIMPHGKGTGYLVFDIPQSTLNSIAAILPQMAELVKKDGGLKINAAGFVTPDGYGNIADMNFIPDRMAIASAMFAIQMNMLKPALDRAQGKANGISCASHLKQIGLGLAMYSMDHKGNFPEADGPAGLEVLRKDYLPDSKIFCCPGSDSVPAKRGEKLSSANCDYFYFGGFNADAVKNPSNMPLVIEMTDHDVFVNVLFVDGHVSGISLSGDDCDVDDVIKHLFAQKKIDAQQRDLLLKKISKYEGID